MCESRTHTQIERESKREREREREVSYGEVRYVLPEEMQQGSVIGNIARDLRLEVTELDARRARVLAEGTSQLCELDTASGNLLISQRIDREELCAQVSTCVLQYQLLLEEPLQAYSLVLDITDINDNSPVFAAGEITLDLVESTILGRRFPLESAHDPDLGTNSLREYKLSPNDHFALEMSTQINGNTYPELVLKKALDREAQAEHVLKINGIDGGNPVRSGTASIHIRVLDANDNVPVFSQRVYKASVPENSAIGTVIATLNATDSDEGVYGEITFSFSHLSDKMGGVMEIDPLTGQVRVAGLIDYEEASTHELDVQAKDGGGQASHCKLIIDVIDVNDNEPVIEIKASVLENVLRGTVIAKVSAVDADQGYNGNVTYSFTHLEEDSSCPFEINSFTGEIKLTADVDYEVSPNYEINIQAKDPWGVVGASKLIVEIADVNDNSPVITMASYSGRISEDSAPGTVVALISVQDKDSSKNGQVHLNIDENLPFKIKSSLRNYYTLVTDQNLDRERRSKYNITLTATDEGLPPLSSRKTVVLEVTDINDNAPAFSQSVYITQVMENNSPGVSLLRVQATDPDQGQNARISYFLIDSEVNGNLVSTYFSINTESGVIQSLRSLDYEQVKEYKIRVKAQDGGSPPLSSNTTIIVRVQDQNDNPPQVLYPVQTGGSVVAEMVPRSADVGYLVTKVVAVDVDSGQNAWLSYKLQKATDRALFEVGLQNGEIRTVRQVTDKDAVKQRLSVIVEDNGQPSRSATVIVNVAVADSFPEVLSEFTDFPHDKEYNDNLTFYLVLALAVVSFLFITSLVVIISVKIYRWRQSRVLYQSNLPVIPYYPPRYSDTLGTGTLQHVYNYEVCRTTDSRKSDCKYIQPTSQSLVSVDDAVTLQKEEQSSAD
uniref:Protocadherin beta-16-like n=1 Tax=Mastacembelus armatus TaxID=205130 RepID=A0A7N8XT71_9TELE